MPDKAKHEMKPHTKKIDVFTFATYEGVDLKEQGFKELVERAKENQSFASENLSSNTPAVVKVTSGGKSIQLVGFKSKDDKDELRAMVIKTPDGHLHDVNPPIKLKFDAETDVKQGKSKGAVTDDSAKKLVESLKIRLTPKELNDFFGKEGEKVKGITEVVGDIPRFPVKNVDGVVLMQTPPKPAEPKQR